MSSPPESHTNTQGSSTTWTEPPWSGWIETTGDALLILEAARRGMIPRVTRRLVDSERKMITSGSVFVFDEDESGIKRWTDGFFWSPSRILGNFLLYRETEKRGAGHRGPRNDADQGEAASGDGQKSEGQTLSRPRGETTRLGIDRQRERSLVGSLTNSYKFKPGGMMKKTFSLTISGVSQHLISYYKIEDVEQGRLRTASSYPELASLDISPEYLEKTHFRNPPKVEIGVDGIPRYRGEADDVEPSPHVLNSALSVGMPLLSEPLEVGGAIATGVTNGGKRNKRYDPYTNPKGKRKPKGSTTNSSSPASPTDSNSPYAVAPTSFSDPNMAMLQHAHYAAATYGLAPYSYPLGFTIPAPSSIYPGPMFPPPGPPPPAQAQSQQAYYQYYPPHGYPSYWTPYHAGSSYTPPTQSGSPTSPVSASTVASGIESHIKTGEESEDSMAA
ncbi:Gti1/Pac2 family-domain-containing protein [Russula earlei]|uniref:Gti1/Pac2 family-domain-containing protein n=1 Tax=Russula earlei TaxID=71964 RepID=A0ACC0U226_9AGAM|nr:Gti1/Pac2 family-domain-containing protein [Russula earlei]